MCNSSCPRQACCKQANNNQTDSTEAVRLGVVIALMTGLRLREIADLRIGTPRPSRKRRQPTAPPEK